MRKIVFFSVFCMSALCTFSQDFSNKGKDFWVAYGYHQVMSTNNGQNMVLYFATDQATTITITVPGTGYTQTLTSGAVPTVLTSAPIPKTGAQDSRLTSESVTPENKGIHVVADKPIVAYAHIYNQSVSGASILFPTNTLGKEYFSINYTNISNTTNANCWMYVIATDPGTTTVEITPSVATINRPAGIPFTITLTQGQVYNLMATFSNNSSPNQGGDLTGSKIRSISTGNVGCKRIAVFSGSGRISISCTGNSSSSDNYMVQAFPKSAWGMKYLTVPTGGPQLNNIYRICVSDPATVVTVNGAPIAVPLQNGFYYELPSSNIKYKIEADKQIVVAQYTTSQGECGNGTPGDPEVIYLSPVEQNISKVIWNATPNFAITQHYFNVVIPNTGTAISSFKLDGVAVPAGSFTTHPNDVNFAYLVRSVTSGQHTIESDSGFNAIAYGFGSAESYGYNAGTNVKDLYQQVGVESQYGIEASPSVCTGSPFQFKISLPYKPDSMYWDFHGFQSPNVMVNSPNPLTYDSITVINGKTVYWYSLPTFYMYPNVGIFPVSITTYLANAEGCGNVQLIDFDLEVSDPPVANFSWTSTVCTGGTVQFNDLTPIVPKPTYTWWWDFGDPGSGTANNSLARNPTHTYTNPGTYWVRYSTITTPGCLSDTLRKQIIINPFPTATISGNNNVCKNSASPNVTFTGVIGTAPFTFTYTINNGPNQTITTTSGNSVSIPISTATVGSYVYTLISVQDGVSPPCSQLQSGSVTVNVLELPTATISGTTSVCLNGPAQSITFTASAPVAPPFRFTYNINSGPNLTVTTVTGNSVNILAPANVVGTFVYNLVSVQDAASSLCSQAQSGVATITVNPLPTASISGSASLCTNAASPTITFTGSGATAPYTFSYTINNGPVQTLTTVTGNTATLAVPTNIAGTFTYTLLSVKDGSTTQCSNLQNGTAVITVWPLPTPDFITNLPLCEIKQVNFSDRSTPNVGSIIQWNWSFGDPASGALNVSEDQNPVHTFNFPGTYNILLSVKNTNGCISDPVLARTITINPRPNAAYIDPQICLNDSYAQFADTSSVTGGSITAWQWNFDHPSSGALNTSTIQNPQHSYNTVGIKNVELIVTSNAGCKDTVTQTFVVNGDIPVANYSINNINNLCVNDTVRVVNAASVNVGSIIRVDIFWDNIGDPTNFETHLNPRPGDIYKHLYTNFQTPATKNYTIRYRSFSGLTCIDDKYQTITLFAAPNVNFSVMPNTCLNIVPFQITQATETGGLPGTFVYTGAGVTPTGMFNPLAVGPGVYTIKYTFTSTAGCVDADSNVIRVLQPPVALFTVGTPTCQNEQLTFNGSNSTSSAGTINTWTWTYGDLSPVVIQPNANPVSHTYTTAVPVNVELMVTTSDGCKSSPEIKLVDIHPQPKPNFSFSSSVCLPVATVQFTNASTIADGTENAFVYTWNFDHPASGTLNGSQATNPSHTYYAVGPYNVHLQVVSNNRCTNDTTIVVNTIHPKPKAIFDTNKPGVCLGESVFFYDLSDPKDGTTVTRWWDFGDGGTSNDQTKEWLYANANTFPVTLYIVNSFGCYSDTLTKPFTVYPYPEVYAGDDLFVLEGSSVNLNPTVSGNNLQFLWSPATYLNNTQIKNPLCTPTDDMTYSLLVTGAGGCAKSDQIFVQVLKTPLIPNTITPNNDGQHDTWRIKYLDDYPDCKVQIFTRTGQKVFESRGYFTPWDGTLKGKPLPVDTYYYIIEPGSGRAPVKGYVAIVK